MSKAFDSYNEVTFELYTLTGIDRAILKEKMRKSKQREYEVPLSELSNDQFSRLSIGLPLEELEQVTISFFVGDTQFTIHNQKLGQALSYILKTKRDILLLYYFLGLSDTEIARRMKISKSTVQRRRVAAIKELKGFMVTTK